jgi:uncharacterized protein (DUF433 family)
MNLSVHVAAAADALSTPAKAIASRAAVAAESSRCLTGLIDSVRAALGARILVDAYTSRSARGIRGVGGAACPVATVVGMLADGMSDPEILAAYPDLEAEDIREAMRYAAEAVRERELPLVASA